MGMALHLYEVLFKRLQPVKDDLVYIARAKAVALAKLGESFPRAARNPNMACATALDPRQKYRSFRKASISLVDVGVSQRQVEDVWTYMYKRDGHVQPTKVTKNIYDGFYSDDDDVVVDELTRYISEPYLRQNSEISSHEVLLYWKDHSRVYPNLAKMARKYLAIPITSVSAERLFSSARHAIPYTRSCLLPKTIREELLIKSWLKFFSI